MIIKVSAEISEIENRKEIEKNNETKGRFFENIYFKLIKLQQKDRNKKDMLPVSGIKQNISPCILEPLNG